MSRYCYITEKSPLYTQYEQNKIHKLQSLIIKELIAGLVIFVLFIFQHNFSLANQQNLIAQTPVSNEQVLGIQTSDETPSPTATPLPSPSLTPISLSTIAPQVPTPTVTYLKPHAKNDYKIAVYGDSMVDTMGERLEYLEHSLKKIYPNVNFTLYNYGKGSENVEMGLNRWNNALNYQDRHYPSIVDLRPDIIVIGSFAYNPFSPYIRDRHWVGLTKLVETAKTVTPNVYMLAEIVPLRSNFGKGVNGVNWDESTAYEHSGRIIEQLENVVSLSGNLNVPLIDVYRQSIGHSGLTNPSDGIHPSVSGHEFTSDIIANIIKLN
jgi:hypothetical protein